MRVAFLGATKGMGRAMARLVAERGDAICLLGRNTVDLERSGADLSVRGAAGPVGTVSCDLEKTGRPSPLRSTQPDKHSAAWMPWS